ncbi:hypothetical protein EC988_004464 [Linderina pennispora]|nr:hypothetical protein EC988_004464 [Linderina pennispora]
MTTMSKITSFKASEVEGYIARGWLDAQDSLSNSKSSSAEKPTVHKGTAAAAGTKAASKWGVKKSSTMANQKDLLEELRRQLKN